MDYSRWTEMQPPNPNPPSHNHIDNTHTTTYSHHLQPQNPNPGNPQQPTVLDPYNTQKPHYSVAFDTGFMPPAINPYLPLSSYPHSHGAYPYYQTVSVDSVGVSYYMDPNAGTTMHNWAVQEAVLPYVTGGTIPPNGTEQLVPAIAAIPNSTLWTNPKNRHHGTWKKVPKKTKVVQSAWCEVCKIGCNTKDVLDQHKLGKKHKKNMEKLKEASMPAPVPVPVPVALAGSENAVIGPLENPAKSKSVSGQKSKKKAADSLENLETKRRKVMEGGAAAAAVRTCAICNVVCNSETVFKYHLVGQKHVAMMKKHASGIGIPTAI